MSNKNNDVKKDRNKIKMNEYKIEMIIMMIKNEE